VTGAQVPRRPARANDSAPLVRVLWFSVAAAVVTISLKLGAWAMTGSVGLLSDAAESIVNLVAAVVALLVVKFASRPPDEDHQHGHEKADYFSAGFEGALIIFAAGAIAVTAILRLLDPAPIDNVAIGLAVTAVATAINFAVGRMLLRVGREHGSIVLEADGQHLLTDVWTSVGVAIGVIAVALSGWEELDPLIALAVAANILMTGVALVRRSVGGLMDRALEPPEVAAVEAVLKRHSREEVQFHALRTRRAGRRAFVSVHVLVPGGWTVQRGHDLLEQVEAELAVAVPGAVTAFTHLEPIDDPRSHEDVELDRPRR
jgi:cation diffusion facilitator family transporter